jgi:hypothetical protein
MRPLIFLLGLALGALTQVGCGPAAQVAADVSKPEAAADEPKPEAAADQTNAEAAADESKPEAAAEDRNEPAVGEDFDDAFDEEGFFREPEPESKDGPIEHRVIYEGRSAGIGFGGEYYSFKELLGRRWNGTAVARTQWEWEAMLRQHVWTSQPGRRPEKLPEHPLRAAKIDFDREMVIVVTHMEGSGSIQVKFDPPITKSGNILIAIKRRIPGVLTADMADHAYAVVVPQSNARVVVTVNGHQVFFEDPPPREVTLVVDEARKRYTESDLKIDFVGREADPDDAADVFPFTLFHRGRVTRLEFGDLESWRPPQLSLRAERKPEPIFERLVLHDGRRMHQRRFSENEQFEKMLWRGSDLWTLTNLFLVSRSLNWWDVITYDAEVIDQTKIQGHWCWVIRQLGDREALKLWVSFPHDGLQVIRASWEPQDGPIWTIINSDFRRTDAGVSIPYRSMIYFDGDPWRAVFVRDVSTQRLDDKLFEPE